MKFIDLFSGIGGFHQGAKKLGLECVMACEINNEARKVYKDTYKINDKIFHKDITKIRIEQIPNHDILFAGFPCQPFSHAGSMEGFNHPNGNLFYEIVRIVKEKKPKFIFLENVPNLAKHDKGNTYKVISRTLRDLGYFIPEVPEIISPIDIGIPQHRRRVYIVAYRGLKKAIDIKKYLKKTRIKNLDSFLSNVKKVKHELNDEKLKAINFWKDMILIFNGSLPKPTWLNYDRDQILMFPEWKQKMFKKTVNWMDDNGNIDKIHDIQENHDFPNFVESFKKLEWNLGNSEWTDKVIVQFRPSGIRFKKNDVAPTLVAINQRPYLFWLKRYMTIEEMLKLHGFKNINYSNVSKNDILRMLGNTISVDVVYSIMKGVLNEYE